MKYFSHLNTATQLIQQYDGQEPLHHFLKSFFSQHKKFGSKDRKRISHLCYTFYRVGRAFKGESSHRDSETIHKIILAGLFLCSDKPDELLGIMKPSWNEMITASIDEKLGMINEESSFGPVGLEKIFPFTDELSEGIDKTAFALSHLHQPNLFLRIRPGYQDLVVQKLKQHNIQFQLLHESAIQLQSGFNADELFEIDKEVVVQDLNSQRVGEFMTYILSQFDLRSQFNKGSLLDKRSLLGEGSQFGEGSLAISVWDCCAASGGKSIMAKDILGNIDLTVSDVRESILMNLKKRFKTAGIINYKSIVTDLSHTTSPSTMHHSPFDLIIADLPCTGSGTWSRTPEQLYFFRPSAVEKYNELQQKIASHIIPHLKDKGRLLYITCSVFKKENEQIIHLLSERFSMKIERIELLKGYDKKADTLFAAVLSRL